MRKYVRVRQNSSLHPSMAVALTKAFARLRAPLAEKDPSTLGKRTCRISDDADELSFSNAFCVAHSRTNLHGWNTKMLKSFPVNGKKNCDDSIDLHLKEQNFKPAVKLIGKFSIPGIARTFPKFIFVHFLGFGDAEYFVGNRFSLVLLFARIVYCIIAVKRSMRMVMWVKRARAHIYGEGWRGQFLKQ